MDIEITPKVKRSFELDPKNELAIRNAYNTPQKSYNCAGLALRAYNWITPYSEEEDEDYDDYDPYTETDRECLIEDWLNDDGCSEDEVANKILIKDAEQLVKRFPFLQQVKLEDTKDSDIVIAYRLFIKADKLTNDRYIIDDTDFHFKVRYNGFWFEKLGGGRTTICDLDPDDCWEYIDGDLIYDSDIIYFKDTRGMDI